MRILAFGEILWDMIQGNEHLGGAPFNFAAHSAQCGAESSIISRLGDDYLGIRAFNKCKQYGVDQMLLQWDLDHPTGKVHVSLVDGQPDYIIERNVAYDFIEFDPLAKVLCQNYYDVFYLGTLAQRSPVSKRTLQSILAKFKFQHVFYDVNLRKNCYSEQDIQESLGFATIFKLNHDELPVISKLILGKHFSFKEFCENLQHHFPNILTIIITASEQGCYVFHSSTLSHIPGVPVKVVDAVGAGDAFSASYMRAFFATNDAHFAAEIANKVGAFVASRSGAVPEYTPEIQQILRGLKEVA